MIEPPLPRQNGLDTVTFSKTLSATDTSYKYLWLLALMETLKEHKYQFTKPIKLDDIFVVMLKLANAPVCKFKLYFGIRDQMERLLSDLNNNSQHIDIWNQASSGIKENPAFRNAKTVLGAHVPYRWLRPFVERETAGAGGKTRQRKAIHDAIIKTTYARFRGENPPPYYINSNNTSGEIIIHEKWAEYFSGNAEVIKGWCLWHFAKFLQVRNPNVPAIVNKITAGGERERRSALKKQKDFWNGVIDKSGGVCCLYSGKPLTKDGFDLDHYVPWSFVGHDNIWNLIPADSSVNSSKSDKLPDNRYLDGLISAHHNALTTWHKHFDGKGKDIMESYIADLKLTMTDLTDSNKLSAAYRLFIPPLIELAKANRFESGWVYNSKTPLLDER